MSWTKISSFFSENKILIFILIFAFAVRIVLLNKFPIGLTHDELNYIISAKSIFWDHKFAPGTPPAVIPTKDSFYTVSVAEVPAMILSVLVGWLPTTLFTSRIVGAIFSTLMILGVFLTSLELTKNKTISIISAAVTAINPWSFLMGRTVFEVNFFVTFFLFGFWILARSKDWKIFLSLPFYILAFFSYTGGQLVFYLFMVATLFYKLFSQKKPTSKVTKILIVYFFLISFVLISYVFVVFGNQTYKVRGSEIYTPSQSEVIKTVNLERQLSVPSSVNTLFVNKYTVYFQGLLLKYLNSYSTSFLFVTGETRAAFSFQQHGTFYFLDFALIIFGVGYLFSVNKKSWFFTVFVIAISTLTSAISNIEYSYSQRSGLMFPFLVILSSVGIYYLLDIFKNNLTKRILGLTLLGIYLILFANLMHTYFFRFPVYASDGWFFQDRVLAKYISLELDKNTKIVVHTSEPKIIYEEFLFYKNIYDSNNVNLINSKLSLKNFSWNNISFVNDCSFDKSRVEIYDATLGCSNLGKDFLRIQRLKDVYANYVIYNDKVCQSYKLSTYVTSQAYLNFDIEGSSPEIFCQNWITKI